MIDPNIPTRPIMWNVEGLGNAAVMYGLLVLATIVAANGLFRRFELWKTGKPSPDYQGNWIGRAKDFVTWAVLQRGVVRDRSGGVMHTLIYVGFVVLTFTTTMVMLDHDFGVRIYQGDFYLAVTFASDIFGFGLLVGCMLAASRRYIRRSDRVHSRRADSLLLIVLCLLIVQGFILEGLRIHVTDDKWARYSPVGYLVAGFFWPLSETASRVVHFTVWWFHTITVFTFLAVMPYTKFFHVLASSVNLFFRRSNRPKGAMSHPGDLVAMMESGEEFSIGRATIKDYSWKELMDLDACTSCGRCQDACPAYASGKPLSPKWLILDTRNHALGLSISGQMGGSSLPTPAVRVDSFLTGAFLGSSGLQRQADGSWKYEDNGAFRASNVEVQKAARSLAVSPDQRILGEVMDQNVFWSCTTCMACVEACPVGINHVDQILENRRNAVLMQGELPTEAQSTLRALENRSNPFGAPEDRIKWMDGLDVKVLVPGDRVDYLYWVGCVSAYDARKQKIARALVKLMNHAGLSFGILGTAEGCSGDPARRLGEENLFQTLAKSNLEILKSVGFKYLVANCPHCFNTIKNEYPQLGLLADGEKPEILHHSHLLKRLLAENKLELDTSEDKYTFHDPCYLGRYNDEYEAPRSVLNHRASLPIIEMDRSANKAMCCGAGGGHFWMDQKIGERVNSIRTDQAAETGADKIATACPFCMQMLEDGVKLTGREGKLDVKDIAEVLVERLVTVKTKTDSPH